jgi:hypothetical protein
MTEKSQDEKTSCPPSLAERRRTACRPTFQLQRRVAVGTANRPLFTDTNFGCSAAIALPIAMPPSAITQSGAEDSDSVQDWNHPITEGAKTRCG